MSNSSNKSKKATTTTNNNNKNPVLSKSKNCISDKKLDLPKGTGRMGGLVKKPSTPSSSSSLSSPSLPKSSTSSYTFHFLTALNMLIDHSLPMKLKSKLILRGLISFFLFYFNYKNKFNFHIILIFLYLTSRFA